MARRFACAALVGAVVVSLVSFSQLSAGEVDVNAPPPKISSTEAVLRALDEPTEFEFLDTPLPDAADFIKQLSHINVLIDKKALEQAGVAADAPVNLTIKDVSLRSALKMLLRPLNLTYHVQNEVLVISTPEVVGGTLSIKTYDVADLVKNKAADGPVYDADTLTEAIEATVAPTTWEAVGGPGSISHFDGTLVVNQTTENHAELAGLLAAIRKVGSADYTKGAPRSWAAATSDKASPVEAAMQQLVNFEFDQTPIADVAAYLHTQYRIPVWVDYRSLEEAGLSADTALTLHIKDIRLKSALKLLFAPADLTYLIHDETLQITTPEIASSVMAIAVYGVRDLIETEMRDNGGDSVEAYDKLFELLTSNVASTTWDEVGGPGAIRTLPDQDALIVSQTGDVHKQFETLLAQLRTRRPERKTEAARAPQLKLVIYSTVPLVDPSAGARKGPTLPSAENLATLLPQFVAPQSWNTPQVTIQASGDYLLIRQTPAVHREIAKFMGNPPSGPTLGEVQGGGGSGFFSVADPAR